MQYIVSKQKKLEIKKSISYYEKDQINKIKCFKENNIAKFEVIGNFYSDLPRINVGWKSNNEQGFFAQNIIAQNVALIYKRTDTTYIKIFDCKSQEFLGNRHLLCFFPSKHSIPIYTRVCCLFYHPHHLWLHHCC